MTNIIERVTFTTLAALMLLMSVETARGDEPLTADSIPRAWTYVPEKYQEIPGGQMTNGGDASPTRCLTRSSSSGYSATMTSASPTGGRKSPGRR